MGRERGTLDRDCSAEDFARFLTWLHPDPDRGAERYKDIQRRLTRLFAYRGCDEPEALADETISRVLHRAPELIDHYEGDPVHYFLGVARNVVRQHFTARERARGLAWHAVHEPNPAELERRHACLDACLEKRLSAEERVLILDYYRAESGRHITRRAGLAREADVSATALRQRTHRLRLRLQDCLARCLEERAARAEGDLGEH